MKQVQSSANILALQFEELKRHWRSDLLSGFLVFLIALPLSLGIAIGSQFPPMAGVIAAAVGGIVVSIFSGSKLTICGPAAGLIVVIIHGVDVLGNGDLTLGYQTTLAAIVVAGLLQVVFGFMKSGKLSTFFPGAVVHGMMAAIGIIIISKQIHVLVGVKPQSKEILQVIAEIPHSLIHMNPEVAFIGVFSLLMLIFIPKIPFNWLKKVPVPMLVVIVGICFDKIFNLQTQHAYSFFGTQHELGPKFLIQLPKNLADGIVFPNWSLVQTGNFWFVTLSIALVASLESLLSASAVQSLDPLKRKSNFDKDLVAIGLGTTVSGLIGGLPMIAEIVRSSANVNNGAKTPWANFFHGVFIVLFVVGVPNLVQQIPLASLAALLVFVGWRLGSPKEFVKIYKIGWDQLVIFVSTVVMTIATDLLVGVAFGIVVKIVIHLLRGLKLEEIFLTNVIVDSNKGDVANIVVKRAAVFWSIYKIKDTLYNLPNARTINLDFTDCVLVDHSMMEFLEHFKEDCQAEGVALNISGISDLKLESSHHLATRKKR